MADLVSVVINKLDESFTPQDSAQYGLAIIFNETSLSYCIFDFKRNKVLGLHQMMRSDAAHRLAPQNARTSFSEFMKSVFSATPWLKNSYKVTKIAYEGGRSTLVPSALFEQSEKSLYVGFTSGLSEDEQVLSDHLIPMDVYQVFTVPSETLNTLRGLMPHARVVHHSSVLIGSIWLNYRNRINTNRAFIHIREHLFDIMIFDGRQLTFFNTFPYHQAEDVVYYLIFVLEQLNFNPESMPLVLLGQVEKGSGIYSLLSRYVRNIEFGRRNESFKYSYLFNQVAPHSHYPLFNFLSCGL